MASAFLWGLLAASSLVLGGLLASWVPLRKRTLGVILAFGAGVLLSATAYELVFEAVRLAKGSGFPALGFFGGAATFFLADQLRTRTTPPRNRRWSFRSFSEPPSMEYPSPS
jgi:ZIP family zinc transporter